MIAIGEHCTTDRPRREYVPQQATEQQRDPEPEALRVAIGLNRSLFHLVSM
jgi:hypothetical protein